MSTKTKVKSTNELADVFALAAGATTEPKTPATKKKAKMVDFSVIYDGVVIDTVRASTLERAQVKASDNYSDPVVAVAADADAATLRKAKRQSKVVAAEAEAAAAAKKSKRKSKGGVAVASTDAAPVTRKKRVPRTAAQIEEERKYKLIRKYAIRKIHRHVIVNEIPKDVTQPLEVRPVDDTFVFAVPLEEGKRKYFGLDGLNVYPIKAAEFKAAPIHRPGKGPANG